MAADEVEIEVAAAPDAVWAVVGDFGGVAEYLTAIESCRLEGDDRVLSMFGMEIREHLVERDEAARSLTYSLVEGVPVESHRATITVHEGDGAASSRVTWSFEVSPDEMAPVFTDTYRQGLAAIEARFA